MLTVSSRVLRPALRPVLLSHPVVGYRGLHVTSRLRQTTETPRPGAPAGAPTPEKESGSQNTYVAMGAGAVALGFIVWWLTGAPAEAKTTHHSHPTSK